MSSDTVLGIFPSRRTDECEKDYLSKKWPIGWVFQGRGAGTGERKSSSYCKSFMYIPALRKICLGAVNKQVKVSNALRDFWISYNSQYDLPKLECSSPKFQSAGIFQGLSQFLSPNLFIQFLLMKKDIIFSKWKLVKVLKIYFIVTIKFKIEMDVSQQSNTNTL